MMSGAFFLSPRAPSLLTVTMLDVGQGDALLLTTPTGERVLIDGGPDDRVLSELGAVMPFDRTIDLVVLTHPDADHVTGLIAVLERYAVARVLISGIEQDTPEYRLFVDRVRTSGTTIVYAHAPQRILLGEVVIDVLWPDRPMVGTTPNSPNDASIVFALSYEDVRMIFTGDIEENVEARLVQMGMLSADVLKVAHHGSHSSSTQDFLNAITPQIALISVGEKNSFGHPSMRILRTLERIGASIYRTDQDGRTTLTTDGRTISVTTQRK
jgi:competence protein ComEC